MIFYDFMNDCLYNVYICIKTYTNSTYFEPYSLFFHSSFSLFIQPPFLHPSLALIQNNTTSPEHILLLFELSILYFDNWHNASLIPFLHVPHSYNSFWNGCLHLAQKRFFQQVNSQKPRTEWGICTPLLQNWKPVCSIQRADCNKLWDGQKVFWAKCCIS